ncbi:hypothetical protein [Nocardia wallacei]|uniref:hypothetical protein n=1 Tax=Nocardia wallacei TaxID=480035 RepID=UPI002456831D|nr:hypothetical protein [Nocardia wallacei]
MRGVRRGPAARPRPVLGRVARLGVDRLGARHLDFGQGTVLWSVLADFTTDHRRHPADPETAEFRLHRALD